MKIANVKGMIAKGMMVAMVAGALVAVAPVKAEAQQFAVGVQFGRPAYGPVYGPGYGYDRLAFERQQEFLRREEFLRHEEWIRAHRFERPYGYRR